MREGKPFKLKICLVGEKAVGKTSLVKRYVFNEFDNKYITTIGTKVVKKIISIKHPKDDRILDAHLLVWDIIGQKGFRQLLQEAYFSGVQGIIGVCDNTRESTLSELESWIDEVHQITQDIPTVFLGNKCDLTDLQEIGLNELKSFSSRYESPGAYLTSAKTGVNVDLSFNILSDKLLKDNL